MSGPKGQLTEGDVEVRLLRQNLNHIEPTRPSTNPHSRRSPCLPSALHCAASALITCAVVAQSLPDHRSSLALGAQIIKQCVVAAPFRQKILTAALSAGKLPAHANNIVVLISLCLQTDDDKATALGLDALPQLTSCVEALATVGVREVRPWDHIDGALRLAGRICDHLKSLPLDSERRARAINAWGISAPNAPLLKSLFTLLHSLRPPSPGDPGARLTERLRISCLDLMSHMASLDLLCAKLVISTLLAQHSLPAAEVAANEAEGAPPPRVCACDARADVTHYAHSSRRVHTVKLRIASILCIAPKAAALHTAFIAASSSLPAQVAVGSRRTRSRGCRSRRRASLPKRTPRSCCRTTISPRCCSTPRSTRMARTTRSCSRRGVPLTLSTGLSAVSPVLISFSAILLSQCYPS